MEKDNTKTSAPKPNLSNLPNDNVDQDGNCVLPAHAESAGLNTGDSCDDGRGAE